MDKKSKEAQGKVKRPLSKAAYLYNADIEDFFRFIYEHSLREEAKEVLEKYLALRAKRNKRSRKTRH